MTRKRGHRISSKWCRSFGGAILLVLTGGLSGCADLAPPTSLPDLRTASPFPTLSVEALAAAVKFRAKYGLRADTGWIQELAVDPSATTYEGVPVTRDEEALLIQRNAPAEAVRTMIDTYASSKVDFAGLATDQAGLVTVLFAGDPEPHRQALLAILPEGARFAVARVKYSRAELLALSREIDAEWLESIGATFVSSGVDTVRNQVRVQVSSTNPVVGPQIVAHYNAEGRMYVESDGVGTASLPTGTLVVVAVSELGEPIPGLIVTYTGAVPGTGSGDVGYETGEDGRWLAEVVATRYSVQLRNDRGLVGTALASVEEGEVTTVRIEVSP